MLPLTTVSVLYWRPSADWLRYEGFVLCQHELIGKGTVIHTHKNWLNIENKVSDFPVVVLSKAITRARNSASLIG